MAIEIIKKGRLPEEKRWRATCSFCRTEFTFGLSDSRLSRDPRDHDIRVVNCPLHGCGKETYASTS